MRNRKPGKTARAFSPEPDAARSFSPAILLTTIAVVSLLSLLAVSSYGTPGSEGGFVICIVAYNRPNYLRQVLSHLAAAEGIEKHTTYFSIEPSDSGVVELAQSFAASKQNIVHVNDQVLGCHANIQRAMKAAFELGDFVVLVEDDIILAQDSLQWLSFARKTYANDPSVFSVSTYGDSCHVGDSCHFEQSSVGKDMNFALAKRRHFTPWGWGLWRDRFEEFADNYVGWDMQMNFQVDMADAISGTVDHSRPGLRQDRFEVFPVLSRSNNIGLDAGIHADFRTHEEMMKQQYLRFWAGNLSNIGRQHTEFHDVTDRDDLCSLITFGSDTVKFMCQIEKTKELLKQMAPKTFKWPVGEAPPARVGAIVIKTEADARKAQEEARVLYASGKAEEAIEFDVALAEYL
jgi:glycosyltransferase involved in cell wall biosynthesis